ncbi:MAG: alpha/beta fold hydrolase [Candidatus Aureabacteria bacterium]|nr:alpha/beta fold hydrolase [Candidatus Auribacterota bacterium]
MQMAEPIPEIKECVAGDGVKLRYREWIPQNPKAAVVCLHGIRSHSAWYTDSCAHLCRKGYRILFPDRRGSGINRESAELAPRYERWIEDVECFLAIAAGELPGKPLHLLGISWGARLAAVVGSRGRVPLRSVIFSAPGIVSRVDYPLRVKVAVAASLLLRSNREFAIPLEDPALFTDNPDEQGYIEEDALGLRRVNARFLRESRKLERVAKTEFIRIGIPLLLLLAGRDEIVDNRNLRVLFDACASREKELKVYEGARHTLEFDSCHQEYFEDVARWFEKYS